MELSVTDLRELVTALSQSDIVELTLKSSDFELTLRKPGAMVSVVAPAPVTPRSLEDTAPNNPPMAEPVAASPPAPPATPPGKGSDLLSINSPMVGTFYRSPAPEEPAFVGVGDRITSGQTVCIIEAMKLMNELEAEISGEIVEILVENAQPVEFGQTLMLVRPV
ncbi:acetyl-CoA carboxylase biotin carboxyl carrier protein [Phormidium tenue]|uniref:Biotin carboxyl carrier protein of acetyl-CoA carboxylase n=1 Tax=Phormidium tenue NIES-30 TaxID=549789 RepID=A0A1U7J688_9CYAN|nr:acetyl-CoA carboxylase biotin carboxyl carrier protein [Phormidium tenue]MBD2231964.1 acetyl-CoA carboxylase biotin carboxyl carrier protein [Phormidium tenue FACHB-1052]OKH48438.1 acetyl-CoA carboxylase, biotin carboxyl carrier protein [Phormidium tenue NIES-30]